MLNREFFGTRPFVPYRLQSKDSIVILDAFGRFAFLRQKIVEQVGSHVDDLLVAYAVVCELIVKALRD